MRSYLLLFVVAACILCGISLTRADTIAGGYSTTNASRLVEVPSSPYVSETFYLGNATTLFSAYATYNITDSTNNFTAGPIYVPRSITLPYPYCVLAPFYEVASTTPASCRGGQLLYGYRSIGPIPNYSNIINGAIDSSIEGITIPALDVGTLQSRGTITWIPPLTCNLANNSAFELDLQINGLTDVNDIVPVAITDSSSNFTVYAVTYGLGCSNAPRPIGSSAIDAMASFIPICRSYVPYNTTIYNMATYSTMFSSSYRGPTNVPPDAIVYQLRVDNLSPNLQVYAHVRFVYPDNTQVDINPLFTGFDSVIYVTSDGHLPALVSVCFYGENCVPVQKWNEAQLGYLQPCDCAVSTSQNLPCNGTTNVILNTPLPRASIPNFPPTLPFVDAPTCVFYVNPGASGANPIVGVPFQVQSGSSGGVGAIFYQWQFTNLPSLAGYIVPPGNTQTISAVVNVATTVTLTLTVSNLNGVARNCSQSITISPGIPVACVTPSQYFGLPVATYLTLDATCSYSPKHLNLTYAWAVEFQPGGLGNGLIIPTNQPVVSFYGSLPGVYIVLLVINDGETTSSTISRIVTVTPTATPSPSATPTAPTAAPFACYVPSPPFSLPIAPPQTLPPLNIIPQPPGVPPPPPSSPAYFPPSNIATLSDTSITWLIIGACVLAAIFLCGNLVYMWTPQRGNPRSWFTNTAVV